MLVQVALELLQFDFITYCISNNKYMCRDSSPEVSTTSSESDDDDNGKEVDRKKKLTKRKEVTSSKVARAIFLDYFFVFEPSHFSQSIPSVIYPLPLFG